ncbi:MAG: PAS domain S-box protein [Myxococcales bacterium]
MGGVSDTEVDSVDPRLALRLEAVSRSGGGALIAIGVAVLVGWWLRVPSLLHLGSTYAMMKPNTAFCFLCLGTTISLLNTKDGAWLRVRQVLPWVVLVVASLTLLEYLLGRDFGIDTVLARSAGSDRWPVRMTPGAALSFCLLASSLLLHSQHAHGRRRSAEWIAALVGSSSCAVLLSYLYGVQSLYAVRFFASMALHTALAFIVCAASILLALPEQGIVRLVSSKTAGGLLARRLLPPIFLVPTILGWLRVRGQHAELFGTAFGTAVFAASCMLCLSILILWTAQALRRSDLERTAAERRLQESEEHLAITLASIGDGVITTDLNGRITSLNPVAVVLTGWSPGAAAGQPLSEVFRVLDEDSFEPTVSTAERILSDGPVGGLTSHAVLVSRDGTRRPIADSAASIRDALGAIRGVVLVFRDETEERNAERALLESEARFKHLAYSGILGIIIADLDGRIHEMNDALLLMLGYTRADFEAGLVKLPELTPPEWRAQDQLAIEQFKNVGTVFAREKEYYRKDRSRVPVMVGAATLEGSRIIAFVLDLSELKRAEQVGARAVASAERASADRVRIEEALRQTEEQLRQSQKMEAIGTLAGSVAHDFNNLLSVIVSYADLLLTDVGAHSPLRADLEQIARAGQRAGDLTRQLLAFSRQQVLQPKLVNFNDAIASMAKMLRRLIGEHIELNVLHGPGLGMVFVDPTQIEQVVLNLVVNARDAMPRGGKLTIESGDVDLERSYANEHLGVEPGPYVMLSVSDTGTGMDRETQQRIFEPFFTTKERGKGTGLGLSTVFGIVKQSGGSIWVYSEPNEGSTFKVYLPRADARDQFQERFNAPPETLRGSETILLTEDDEQVRGLANAILTKHGYHVIEAPTGGDALLICEQYKGAIHLLLTDVVMPRIGGRQLWERLAPLRPGMKVLFMSGYTDDAIIHHGVLSSEFAFVQKPLMPAHLLTKLRSVLDEQLPHAPRRSTAPPASVR